MKFGDLIKWRNRILVFKAAALKAIRGGYLFTKRAQISQRVCFITGLQLKADVLIKRITESMQ